MSLINEFCKDNNIEKYIMINFFNNLDTILKSKKDSILFIRLIIKSCIMSNSTKKDNYNLVITINKTINNKYFKYKKLNLIFELCPQFAKILSQSLNMTINEIRRLFDKNKISVDYIINLIVTQSKKHTF